MTGLRGELFVKTGAEGVFCAALPDSGLGIAIKCDDGASRASEAVMAAVIAAFVREAGDDELRTRPVLSRRGRKVGEIRPIAGLVEALRDGRPIS
jgi:L-asparaginase II